jgi:hypothetical protein
VVTEYAAPVSGGMTCEAAGRRFHEKCLRSRGLLGASSISDPKFQTLFTRHLVDRHQRGAEL